MNIVADLHTHTLASGHAYSTLTENAKAAFENGIDILAVTEHAPSMPGTCSYFYYYNYKAVPRQLHSVELLLGVELNIMDYKGAVDLENDMLEMMDIVIASLHPPCIPYGTEKENTAAILGAMENPYINIIGHPGDPRYPTDWEQVVKQSKETGTLLEVNNTSLGTKTYRVGSRDCLVEILNLCMKHDVPVCMGSDAHFYTDIGLFQETLDLFREVEMPEELVVNTSVEKVRKFLKK